MPKLPRNQVLDSLESILSSVALHKSKGPKKLLAYIVPKALDGVYVTQDDVAREAFKMGDAFDKTIDANVRTAAKNLRTKLALYYRTEGVADPIEISVPKGGYIPSFVLRTPAALVPTRNQAEEAPFPLTAPDRTTINDLGNVFYERRRRYLAWAQLAWPAPEVLNEVARHYQAPTPETATMLDLPNALAAALNLRATLSFRANATQAIRDALQACLSHLLFHGSRPGEEGADIARLLMRRRSCNGDEVGSVLYSDVDHPAVKQIVASVWPKAGNEPELALAKLVHSDERVDPKSVAALYLNRMEDCKVSAIVIPHVTWQSGVCLDIKELCRALRAVDPFVTIIVDGAQATGHVQPNLETCEQENDDVDFYVGCGHKWLQGPEAIGFLRVGRRYLSQCSECQRAITSSDTVTDVSGSALGYRGSQIGTQHRAVAIGLARSLRLLTGRRGGIEGIYSAIIQRAEIIRNCVQSSSRLVPLNPAPNMLSGIVSFTFRESDKFFAERLRARLHSDGFTASVYPIPESRTGQLFFRLSPSFEVTDADLADLATLFRECA